MRKHTCTRVRSYVDLVKQIDCDGPNPMGASLRELDNYHLAVRQIGCRAATDRSKAVAQ